MFGHVETNAHRAAHLGVIRDIQKEIGGITELVPLSFVHADAPMWSKHMLTDFNAKNGAEFVTDLNQAINRCNQISTDFKSGFKSFCDGHPGLCKQTFHIGPF